MQPYSRLLCTTHSNDAFPLLNAVPSEVVNLRVDIVSPDQFLVLWDSPLSPNGAVTYTVVVVHLIDFTFTPLSNVMENQLDISDGGEFSIGMCV